MLPILSIFFYPELDGPEGLNALPIQMTPKKEEMLSKESGATEKKPRVDFKLNRDAKPPSATPMRLHNWKCVNWPKLAKGGLESHYNTFFYSFPCMSIARQEDELRLAAKQGRIGRVQHLIERDGVSINGRGTAYSTCSIVQLFNN